MGYARLIGNIPGTLTDHKKVGPPLSSGMLTLLTEAITSDAGYPGGYLSTWIMPLLSLIIPRRRDTVREYILR